jgi:UDP-GlcNAc:undecaprenyl-phosphate GlcNAc-1-phosphate transferase
VTHAIFQPGPGTASALDRAATLTTPATGLPATLVTPPPAAASPEVVEIVKAMVDDPKSAAERIDALAQAVGLSTHPAVSRWDVFHQYIGVFIVAFLVALVATPIMRRLAIANGIVDRPNEARKIHKYPIAYLGGVGVFAGIVAGVFFSYLAPEFGAMTFHAVKPANLQDGIVARVPLSILGGMTIIMLVGLLDDVLNISPWQKVGGQLLAAAFLALEDVGVKVAYQIMRPIGELLGNPDLLWKIPLPFMLPGGGDFIPIDLVYWTGTAIIAVFILGACNASNLVDGLDGLLSGITAICAAGLLVVSLGLAAADVGPLDSARVVMCMALMGACLGFLPHNFNPAVIFLGDCGSLLLGYCTIVIILTLGDRGQTDLVMAGLVIYSVPIIDTSLAIVRRKLSGKKISEGDDQHLHHMLKRAVGVKGAALTLYAMGILFAVLGFALTLGKARVTYAFTIVFVLFIAVTAIKIARRKQHEEQMLSLGTAGNVLAAGGPGASVAAPAASAQALPAATGSPAAGPAASAARTAPVA